MSAVTPKRMREWWWPAGNYGIAPLFGTIILIVWMRTGKVSQNSVNSGIIRPNRPEAAKRHPGGEVFWGGLVRGFCREKSMALTNPDQGRTVPGKALQVP